MSRLEVRHSTKHILSLKPVVKVHPVTLQPIIRPQSWESVVSEITELKLYILFNVNVTSNV